MHRFRVASLLVLCCFLFAALSPCAAQDAAPLSWDGVIARLQRDGHDAGEIRALFDRLQSPPLPVFMGQKLVELYGRPGKSGLTLPPPEAARFAPPDYTRIAGGMSVAAGRNYMNRNAKFFASLYKRYGVPAPFIVAVMMVETGIGAELGRQSALLALGSMAATATLDQALPAVHGLEGKKEDMQSAVSLKSAWAYAELRALIEYATQSGKDAAAIPGSVYGAIGICQFMPSNIPLYGVSTRGKGNAPDVFNAADAAASVACYLSAHGWKKALNPKAQVAVLRSYNHSDIYAATVYGVAMNITAPTTFGGMKSAQKGGNAVSAARRDARAAIPQGKAKKPLTELPNYNELIQ